MKKCESCYYYVQFDNTCCLPDHKTGKDVAEDCDNYDDRYNYDDSDIIDLEGIPF